MFCLLTSVSLVILPLLPESFKLGSEESFPEQPEHSDIKSEAESDPAEMETLTQNSDVINFNPKKVAKLWEGMSVGRKRNNRHKIMLKNFSKDAEDEFEQLLSPTKQNTEDSKSPSREELIEKVTMESQSAEEFEDLGQNNGTSENKRARMTTLIGRPEDSKLSTVVNQVNSWARWAGMTMVDMV